MVLMVDGFVQKWGIRKKPPRVAPFIEEMTINHGGLFFSESKCRTCDGWLMVVDFCRKEASQLLS